MGFSPAVSANAGEDDGLGQDQHEIGRARPREQRLPLGESQVRHGAPAGREPAQLLHSAEVQV